MQRNKEEIKLCDYKVPEFLIDTVDLSFGLDEDSTLVTSSIKYYANPQSLPQAKHLILYGKELILRSIALDGNELNNDQYELTDDTLTIKNVPSFFTLKIITLICPKNNTQVMGLYLSQGNFCTHCEPEGFRRITYFLDRPDVLAKYTTTIVADEKKYPVLLSNGNLIANGKTEDGKHWFKWEDPFKKPSYLFALVAGDYDCLLDNFLTQSGRTIILKIYAEKNQANRCHYAMQALKKAMRWDEENYGRECDLDEYKIVAVSDFKIGGMENKGLNIFSAKLILASKESVTDDDIKDIELYISHEYFHNWTGNRVTCRDWFQFTLKEGLTTFRGQSFLEEWYPLDRLECVNVIRNEQFIEDQGPLAHSVQPQSYLEVENIYTETVYKKGAEIFRMLQLILGKALFRKGMDYYFKHYDGHAITIEDFIKAMSHVSQKNLSQFSLWFYQAGTPVLTIKDSYHPLTMTYTLTVKQSYPDAPEPINKKPLMIPIRMGLLNNQGDKIPLHLAGSNTTLIENEIVLLLTKSEQTFQFHYVAGKPVPSLLRGFSAPVEYHYSYEQNDLLLLLKYDCDLFNRCEASKQYINHYLLQLIAHYLPKKKIVISNEFTNAFYVLLTHPIDLDTLANILTLPTESELADQMKKVDVEAIVDVRKAVMVELATTYREDFLKLYHANNLAFDKTTSGMRHIKNIALEYLMNLNEAAIHQLAVDQFNLSLGQNMTDNLAALSMLNHIDCPERSEALDKFYKEWRHSLEVNFWFEIQASSSLPSTLMTLSQLVKHPDLDTKNASNVFCFVDPFCKNLLAFHSISGKGYELLANFVLEIDKFHPEVVEDVVKPLTEFQKYDPVRQRLMREQLEKLEKQDYLSANLYEIVNQTLNANRRPKIDNKIFYGLPSTNNKVLFKKALFPKVLFKHKIEKTLDELLPKKRRKYEKR